MLIVGTQAHFQHAGTFMKMNNDTFLQIAKIFQPINGGSVLELHKISV